MRGEEEKNLRSKIWNILTQQNCNTHRLMAQGASLRIYKDNKNNSKWEQAIGRVLPIHGNIA
jgi:hypothetical protein